MRGVALLSATLYALASMSGVLVNKAVFASYDFKYPLVILLLQLVVTTIGMVVTAPPPVPERLTPLLPVSFSFVFNVFAGLLALQVTNVPMFSAFRRLSVLSVMITETLALGKRETPYVEWAVSVMTLGSLIAAAGDAQANMIGYALVFVNNFATAAYLVALKRASKAVKLSGISMTFYVNLLSIPIAFIVCLLTGQLQGALATVRDAPELQTLSFALAILVSSCSAFAINLSTLWCTAVNTPLTTAIAGQTKNVLQTLLGLVMWDYQLTVLNAFGLLVAFVGSCMFGHAKFIVTVGGGSGAGSGTAGTVGNGAMTRASDVSSSSSSGGGGGGGGGNGDGGTGVANWIHRHQHGHHRRHIPPRSGVVVSAPAGDSAHAAGGAPGAADRKGNVSDADGNADDLVPFRETNGMAAGDGGVARGDEHGGRVVTQP